MEKQGDYYMLKMAFETFRRLVSRLFQRTAETDNPIARGLGEGLDDFYGRLVIQRPGAWREYARQNDVGMGFCICSARRVLLSGKPAFSDAEKKRARQVIDKWLEQDHCQYLGFYTEWKAKATAAGDQAAANEFNAMIEAENQRFLEIRWNDDSA